MPMTERDRTQQFVAWMIISVAIVCGAALAITGIPATLLSFR